MDARKLFENAVEREWWYNFDTGYVKVSFVQKPGLPVHIRVFKERRLTVPERRKLLDIRDALEKWGLDVDKEELRVLLNDHYRELKESAEAEIVDKQDFLAGIHVSQHVMAFEPPEGLMRLPKDIVGPRLLDHYPQYFGARCCGPNFIGIPVRIEEPGNMLHICDVGINKMGRPELKAHLEARGIVFQAKDENGWNIHQSMDDLRGDLSKSVAKEKAQRTIHWFCQAGDKCRNKDFCITYVPGLDLKSVGYIKSWDRAKGRKPPKVTLIYDHMREHHWETLIATGNAEVLPSVVPS